MTPRAEKLMRKRERWIIAALFYLAGIWGTQFYLNEDYDRCQYPTEEGQFAMSLGWPVYWFFHSAYLASGGKKPCSTKD